MRPEEVTSKKTGEPTWGIVGTLHQLHTLVKTMPAKVIAFADSSQNGFRQELLHTYKRKSGENYIRQQLDRLSTTLPLLGIPVHGANNEYPGMEAEDVISKAVMSSQELVVVVSYDKDLIQLVDASTSFWNPQKKILLTPDNVGDFIREEYLPTQAPLSASDFAVFLAVTGDTNDGVHPIGGIGPVTLGKFYAKLPTDITLTNPEKLERLAEIEKETGKQQANWKLAHTNLAVTDLKTARQEEIPFADKELPTPDKQAFKAVLEELTMPSLLNQLDAWFAPFENLNRQDPAIT